MFAEWWVISPTPATFGVWPLKVFPFLGSDHGIQPRLEVKNTQLIDHNGHGAEMDATYSQTNVNIESYPLPQANLTDYDTNFRP